MQRETISVEEMTWQIRKLGVLSGSVLLVHCAFSKVKPVEGGPLGLITALQNALGPEGTLVMPSMSDDDDHLFNPLTTPCRWLGIVADTFWRLPSVLRSSNPHAFAAKGPFAKYVTSTHPIEDPHGRDSPVARVHELDGFVMLLGVGHEADTTVHLAENLAGVRYRLPRYITVIKDGQVTRVHYLEIDHCCRKFSLVDGWLDARNLQRRGLVGNAEVRLVRSQDIVDTVVRHLRRDETAFLHQLGVDIECDEAWASLSKF